MGSADSAEVGVSGGPESGSSPGDPCLTFAVSYPQPPPVDGEPWAAPHQICALSTEWSSRFSGPSWLVGPSAGSAGLEEQPALPDEVWLVDEERHQPNL